MISEQVGANLGNNVAPGTNQRKGRYPFLFVKLGVSSSRSTGRSQKVWEAKPEAS